MNPAGPAHDGLVTKRVLSIIVPVYCNEASIPRLLDRFAAIDFGDSIDCRMVFVVDGSPDASADVLRKRLDDFKFPATLVSLSRNFGSFPAIRAGLEHAAADYFAVVAADLQEPPELLLSFLDRLEGGDVDLVLGAREGRNDPPMTRLTAGVFWWLYRKFVQPTMPTGGADVFACNDTVRRAMLEMREANSSLIGQLLWVGFRQATVPYERLARTEGRSEWTLRKKLRYMSDSVFAFTDLPVRLLLFTGVFGCVTTVGLGLAVFVARLFDLIAVPGYAALMIAVLFVGALTTLSMGVVGSYVWRTFENTKRRPLTIEQSVERFPRDADG